MVVELIDLGDDGDVDVGDGEEEMDVGWEMEEEGNQQYVLMC